MKTTCAVILTYNRIDRIKRCLQAVNLQLPRPDAILVVDNCSSDGTYDYLIQARENYSSLRLLRTEENLGPAGGFAIGMKHAVESGFDFIWLLDDDSIPEPSCLATLRSVFHDDNLNAIAWPNNVDEFGNTDNFPAWRGQLVPSQIIKQAGLPNADFFWRQEDTEYFQWRLPVLYGVESIAVPLATVHFVSSNSRKSTSWEYYYSARNLIYYRLRIQYPRKYSKLLFSITRMFIKIIYVEKQKLRKTRYFVLGIWHGLRGKLGKTIDPSLVQ